MFIPRVTALGIGASALATAVGLGITTSLPNERAQGWGTPPAPERLAFGGATLAATLSTISFGLFSPMKGLRPVLASIGALAGAAAIGTTAGSLLKPHAN
ncbi:MAG: hypothetical protein JWN72_2024 [Thermoleophilia bacterium]|nr:hypothetical protein [Thermoleophilia bacterium]